MLARIDEAEERTRHIFSEFRRDVATLRETLLNTHEDGAQEHGMRSFQPGVAREELTQECLDMLGWGALLDYVEARSDSSETSPK